MSASIIDLQRSTLVTGTAQARAFLLQGWKPRTSSLLSVEGTIIFLDIPLYRTRFFKRLAERLIG